MCAHQNLESQRILIILLVIYVRLYARDAIEADKGETEHKHRLGTSQAINRGHDIHRSGQIPQKLCAKRAVGFVVTEERYHGQ